MAPKHGSTELRGGRESKGSLLRMSVEKAELGPVLFAFSSFHLSGGVVGAVTLAGE